MFHILLDLLSSALYKKCCLMNQSKLFSPAECTDLNDPDFGRVSVTGLVLGSVATYMCNSGYTLVGNMTRDCVQLNSNTADWSDKAPVCTRMFAQPLSV